MGLKLNWTEFSKNELRKIFLYHKSNTNLKTGKNIAREISREILIPEKFPFIGQKEEMLQGSQQEFRYFLHSNYKIIYYVDLEINLVEIVDIFDCRQELLKIKRTK